MDNTHHTTERPARRVSVIHTLFQWTGRLYSAVRNSAVGRGLSAYRRLDGAVGGGRQGRFRQVSRGRMPVADAVKQSAIIALLRGFMRLLCDLPMKFYGIFILLYGAVGSFLYFLVPLLATSFVPNEAYLTVSAVMMVLSLPPLTSHSTLRQSVSRSPLATLVLNRYFCLPSAPIPPSDEKLPFGASAVAVALACVASVVALFTTPYLVPIILGWLVLCGLVFSYPETGVLMGTALLPVAWVFPDVLTPLAGVILLTWISYGFKLIRLHRTVRYDIADMAVLLLMGLTLISGIGGLIAGTGRLMPTVLLLVCLSVYFLIVHLMTTRAYISRCLFSMGVSAVLMTVVSFFGRMGAGTADWLRGSRGGDLLADAFSSVRGVAVGVGTDSGLLMAILLMPFLCALLLRARRLFTRVAVAALLAVNLYFAVSGGALGALFCVACAIVLFCLLCDHRCLGVGALLLPTAVGCAGWYLAWRDQLSANTVSRLSLARYLREVRFGEMWQRVAESPFGWGVGADCEGGSLALQVLITLGWQGLLVATLTLALLLQKSLTALTYANALADRALVVGLLCGVAGAILRGCACGFLTDTPALLMLILFLGVGSAFANILFDEHDVRLAESMNDACGADRVYRRG